MHTKTCGMLLHQVSISWKGNKLAFTSRYEVRTSVSAVRGHVNMDRLLDMDF